MNAHKAKNRGQWAAGRQFAAAGTPRALGRAFTLVELLIVIAIIGAVTVATVPMILPALDVRRIRESGGLVSTVFSQAQSDALAKGRSAGVWIQRLSNEPSAAMDLFLCAAPEPYSGDTVGSVLTMVTVDSTTKIASFKFNVNDA